MLLLVVVLAAVGAWRLGLVDRVLYMLQVEHAQQEVVSVGEQRSADDAGEGYAYSQLDSDDRVLYAILLDAFSTRTEQACPETSMEDLARIRDCVLADHPELFAVTGVQTNKTTNTGSQIVTSFSVEGQFSCTSEEESIMRQQLEAVAADCLAGLPPGTDDYGKAKYLYEYLVAWIEYDRGVIGDDGAGSSSGQTAYDALVSGRAVCAGYSHAFQYLLQNLGVPCVYVTGIANGGSHAWCAAFLDGAWYYIDPTWGDPQFVGDDEDAAIAGYVNYDYLCVTSADMAMTHVAQSAFPVPDCTSMADNYYVREGLYLESIDLPAVGSIIQDAIARGSSFASFRCAESSVYETLTFALFGEKAIYTYLPGNSCRYVLDDKFLTVKVFF